MEIVDLKCKNCSGELDIIDNEIAICKYCNSKYILERDYPNVIMNTTINNYGPSTDYSYKSNTSIKKDTRIIYIIFILIILFVSTFLLNVFKADNKVSNIEDTSVKDKITSQDFSSYEYIKIDASSQLDTLQNLHKMINLKQLHLYNCQDIKDYSFLNSLPKIISLKIENATYLSDINFLANMNNLEELSIYDSSLTEITPLKNKLSIIYLELNNNPNINDYTAISSLKSLKTLKITPIDENKIPNLNNLKFLETKEFNY